MMLTALQSKLNRGGRRPVFGIAVVVILALCFVFSSSTRASGGECLVSMGPYTGPVYRAKETISNDRCLVGSRWMQLRQHTLRSPTDSVIDDWLFIDYHDRVNVLAEIGGTVPANSAADLYPHRANLFFVRQNAEEIPRFALVTTELSKGKLDITSAIEIIF